MTDSDAKAEMAELRDVLTRLATAGGEKPEALDSISAVNIALKKFDQCDLFKNWIKQLCATINQNNCNVDDITGLALKAIES